MDFLKKMFDRNEKPNYRIIELEAKLDKTKDDLIEQLQKRVEYLEYELLNAKVERNNAYSAIKSEAVETTEPTPTRLKVSTMTQLAGIMEAASIARKRNKEKPDEKDS